MRGSRSDNKVGAGQRFIFLGHATMLGANPSIGHVELKLLGTVIHVIQTSRAGFACLDGYCRITRKIYTCLLWCATSYIRKLF